MGVPNATLYLPRIPVVTEEDVLPPYGVVRLVSSEVNEDDESVWTVAAPESDGEANVYVLGGKSLTNEENDRGDASFLPLGRVAYDDTDGDPAVGEVWGPQGGSFKLRKGYVGFRAVGEGDGFTAPFARLGAMPYCKILSDTPGPPQTTTTSTSTTSTTSSTTTCVPTTTTSTTTTTTTGEPTTTTTTPYPHTSGQNFYSAKLVHYYTYGDVWIESDVEVWFRDIYGRVPVIGSLIPVQEHGFEYERRVFVGIKDDGPPVTTTTTTTPAPCGGLSKWQFNFTLGIWELQEICCSPGCVPNYPTICPEPADGCGTTRTYCIRPRTTTTTTPCPAFTTTSTTTSTTTGAPTTTTPCPTTTAAPNCSGCIYTWVPGFGFVLKENNCSAGAGCACPDPPAGTGSVCYDEEMACQTTTTTAAPASYCVGSCRWAWIDAEVGWLLIQGSCATNFPLVAPCKTCGPCQPPTVPGSICGTQAVTGCPVVDGCPTTTAAPANPCAPTSTTTTTTTPACSGKCRWRWSAFDAEWVFLGSTNCTGSCDCYEPVYAGDTDCSIDENPCTDRTTTTTSTTTTTTTPAPTTTTTTTTSTTTTTTTAGPKWYCVRVTTIWGPGVPPSTGPVCVDKVVGYTFCVQRFPGETVVGDSYNVPCGGGFGYWYVVLAGPFDNEAACLAHPCTTTTTTTTTTAAPTTTTTTTSTTTTTTTTAPAGIWWCCTVGEPCIESASNPAACAGPYLDEAICNNACILE